MKVGDVVKDINDCDWLCSRICKRDQPITDTDIAIVTRVTRNYRRFLESLEVKSDND